jgi:hypothetical protein
VGRKEGLVKGKSELVGVLDGTRDGVVDAGEAVEV